MKDAPLPTLFFFPRTNELMLLGPLPGRGGRGGGVGCIHQVYYITTGQSAALWHELPQQRLSLSLTCANWFRRERVMRGQKVKSGFIKTSAEEFLHNSARVLILTQISPPQPAWRGGRNPAVMWDL